MESTFVSDGLTLHAYTASPERLSPRGTNALILCHGFPDAATGAAGVASSYPDLADRLASELGWLVTTFHYRGCGESDGNFSALGWLADARAAVTHVREIHNVAGVWLAGFGTGGALAVSAAATDESIRGVATLAAPADFGDWASSPEQLLTHARKLGAVVDADFPTDVAAWSEEFRAVSAVDAAPRVLPRPLLVVHGADDGVVPVFDGRFIADAHGEAELRVVVGAGHRLRYDPRAVAVLLGWLTRQV